ncbi:hypothetical protein SEA_CECE_57 [Microbacterium phage Cece]|nr:hypothetical protein SEA_CECE_57 [Microbacterium phage Cece]
MTEDNPTGPSSSIIGPGYAPGWSPSPYRYPGVPMPNTSEGTGANMFPKEPKTVEILMIWVRDGSDPEGVVWLEYAWDRDTVDANPTGWQDKIDSAHKEFGAANVRIAITTVNIDAIDAAFEPVRA